MRTDIDWKAVAGERRELLKELESSGSGLMQMFLDEREQEDGPGGIVFRGGQGQWRTHDQNRRQRSHDRMEEFHDLWEFLVESHVAEALKSGARERLEMIVAAHRAAEVPVRECGEEEMKVRTMRFRHLKTLRQVFGHRPPSLGFLDVSEGVMDFTDAELCRRHAKPFVPRGAEHGLGL